MTMETRHQNILGRRIFRQSIAIATIMTIVLSAVQVWIDYQRLMGEVRSTFDQIKSVHLESLTTALWNFSTPELSTITSGLSNYPFISYVEVQDFQTVVASAGEKRSAGVIIENIPLNYMQDGASIHIGTLMLQADNTEIWFSVVRNIVQIMIFTAINVLILTVIFVVIIDRQITRYLFKAVGLLRTYNISNLDSPLSIDKRNTRDEIDQLIQEFNDLRLRLSLANRQQNESERKYSTLIGNLPGMAYRCRNDENWSMELISAGCYDLTGYKPDEIIENRVKSYNDLIFPEDRMLVWNTIQEQVREKLAFEITYRITTKSGLLRWVWERGIGVFSENHELIALEGFVTDVTERKQQERDLEAIAAVSYALRSVDSRDSILPIILEQTTSLLNTDGCLVELIDQTTGDSVIRVANGMYTELIGTRIPEDSGLNSYIRKSGKPYLSNSVIDDPMNLDIDVDKECKSASGVPMIAQGELIGFIWIGRKVEISDRAVKTLSSIADIAANAIRRVDFFQQTEQRLNRLIGLRKIDTAINNNLDLSIILDEFLDLVIQLLHVDAARVMNYDPQTRMVSTQMSKGFQSDGLEEPHILDLDTEIGKNMLNKVTLQINDINKQAVPHKVRQFMVSEGLQSILLTPLVSENELRGVLQVFCKNPFYPDADWIGFFETMAGQAAIAINESALWTNLQQSNVELHQAYDATLQGWSNALDLRDHETEDHTRRVTELTMQLAGQLGFNEKELKNIWRGALLHDIGKMGVPDEILTKPGKLTAEEWIIMRQHPQYAYDLLSPIDYLWQALEIPYCHHEKWDGSGYPRGLKGEEIPIAARIFALVDVWDAMTSDRYYRAAMPKQEVIDYIEMNSGTHFDPKIARLFLQMIKKSK